MVKSRSVIVRVPATTANLGPGYDCLALSMDIWNEIEFSMSGNSLSIEIEGEGADLLPRDSTNLIYKCMESLAMQTSTMLPQGLQIKCTNRIPVSSGLGSSAAAVIAGLLGAKALLGLQITDQDLLKLALTHEGHADNISACLLGGLVISVLSDDVLFTKKISIKPLNAVIALPEVKISTHQARSVLPVAIALKESVFNIARVGLLVNNLQEGDYDHLRIAMQDRLHQPYRYGLIPGAEEAISGALEAGAYGAALSGAGPSVIAFVEKDNSKVAKKFVQAFEKAGIASKVFNSITTDQGAHVQVL
jgi:homoserine kinase